MKLLFFFSSLACGSAFAQPRPPADRTDFQIALIRYAGGNHDPRPHGLPRLAWEIRKRTSIQAALDTAAVDPSEPLVFDYPLLVWQGDAAFPPLPERAVLNLRQHLTHGGTVLVDVSDAQVRGPFHSSVLRELARIFPEQALSRVPAAHVVYKSFYLIDRHGGRVAAQPHLDGLYVADRLAVIVSLNDLAGAMSRDEFGEWEYDVGPGGEVTREMTFRLVINVVMYALCLDYKEDQVHVQYILRRRR